MFKQEKSEEEKVFTKQALARQAEQEAAQENDLYDLEAVQAACASQPEPKKLDVDKLCDLMGKKPVLVRNKMQGTWLEK